MKQSSVKFEKYSIISCAFWEKYNQLSSLMKIFVKILVYAIFAGHGFLVHSAPHKLGEVDRKPLASKDEYMQDTKKS